MAIRPAYRPARACPGRLAAASANGSDLPTRARSRRRPSMHGAAVTCPIARAADPPHATRHAGDRPVHSDSPGHAARLQDPMPARRRHGPPPGRKAGVSRARTKEAGVKYVMGTFGWPETVRGADDRASRRGLQKGACADGTVDPDECSPPAPSEAVARGATPSLSARLPVAACLELSLRHWPSASTPSGAWSRRPGRVRADGSPPARIWRGCPSSIASRTGPRNSHAWEGSAAPAAGTRPAPCPACEHSGWPARC